MSTLNITNLNVSINNKKILNDLNLKINSGEIHAIMGPNGAGKSTLASAIMGDPKYNILRGNIKLDDKEILDMTVDERAREGLFLAMQYPSEIPGITNSELIKTAINSKNEVNMPLLSYVKKIR